MTRGSFAAALLGLIVLASLPILLVAQARPAQAGDPLPNLTPREFEEFRLGLDDFLEVETAGEGLGPAFNGASCASCHNVPAVGGISPVAEVRAARRTDQGAFEPVDESGETLVHLFSTPGHGCQPAIPIEANVISRRIPIPLFGAGLIEAIDDETLLVLADVQARRRDAVSGRAAIIVDRASGDSRVGRFGWKAQHATLLAFGADAYRNEMGITNDLFPSEVALGVSAAQMRVCDVIPEPEDIPDPRTRRRGIDNFESFMRFLAPLPRATADATAAAGEQIFTALDCASCHVPLLTTGANANPAFHRRPVPLYSDLLLHDIGTGDGIQQGAASPKEMRTPALWGLRFRRPLLHDGSAATVDEAIRRHRGEAEAIRQNYERLDESLRATLRRFLLSL
ncbi:MAG: di-heme oxidoredictase family protein [Vicinamibacterales bacterium]